MSPEGELNGMLGVSRAFGDLAHPPPHCAAPAISVLELPSDASATVVLASDGLWDVVGAEEVAPLLANLPAGTDAGEMAAMLRDEAFARGSADNTSVEVLCLRSMRELCPV